MNKEIILRNLNDRQQKAVKMPQNRPLLIVAGAGSGKTATLTGRFLSLLEMGVQSENIVAITFTNKAADEMKSRLDSASGGLFRDLSSFVGTFHSFGARLLRSESRLVGRLPNFTIFDSSDSARLLRRLLKEMNFDKSNKELSYSFFAGKIGDIKSDLLNINSLSESKNPKDRLAAAVFERYEDALRENNGFDFDDLIEKPALIFSRRPEVLLKYQKKYTHILVDEYQDTNRAQYELIRLLSGENGNLNVVGDDNQAIYGFRGADFRNFLNFDKDFKNTNVVILDQNYRSTKNIIGAASALISHNKNQRPKTLWTENEEGERIKLFEHEDEETEAGWLASAVSPLLKSGSVAVLYRTNAQSRAIEQAFIENGVSYQIFGGLKFYDRKEIKDLVAALAFASNPSDLLSFERVEKGFQKRPSRILKDELPLKAKTLSPPELIKFILESSGYLDLLKRNFPNFSERLENIAELSSFASGFKTLGEFLESVSLFQSSDSAPKSKRGELSSRLVNIMTVHLSKGLEFDYVFVVGASEGLLPHQMSFFKEEDVEEERRLMYVAMTRAGKILHLSFFGLPSRFLSEIPSEFLSFENCANLDDEERYISI